MSVRQPGFGNPCMLRRVGDRNGFMIQLREGRLIICRHEQPQAVNTVGAARVRGQLREQIHPIIAGEQTGIDNQARLFT